MASPLSAAQKKVRPRYRRRRDQIRTQEGQVNQAFRKQAGSLRGAGAATEATINDAIGGLRESGLRGSYLKDTASQLGELAASQDVGVSQQIASARTSRNDELSTLADALETMRQQRGNAVRTEAGQIRAKRKAAAQAARKKAQDKLHEQNQHAKQYTQNVREAVREIRAKIAKEGAGLEPGQVESGAMAVANAVASAAGLPKKGGRSGETQLRHILRRDPKARRNFLDELITSGNAANGHVAETALQLYLRRQAAHSPSNDPNGPSLGR